MTDEEAAAFLGEAGKPKAPGQFSPEEAEAFLGNAGQPTPQVDDLGRSLPGDNPEQDHYIAQSGIGRVLSSFGQGVATGWGAGNLGMEAPLEQAMREAGIYNDVSKGQHSIIRSFNEALMRPAAAALDAAMRVPMAAIGGLQGAVAETGNQLGMPQLGRDIAALPEAFPTGYHSGVPEVPHPIAQVLDKARDEGIIGQMPQVARGEMDAPSPVALNENVAAADRPAAPEPGAVTTPAPDEPGPAAAPEPAPAAPTDVHGFARQIAPDTFNEYDALDTHKTGLRQQIDQETASLQQQAQDAAPGGAEIQRLQARMEDATPRLAKKYQARIDALMPDFQAYMDDFSLSPRIRSFSDAGEPEGMTASRKQIAALRQQLAETDYRMRDLAPDVSDAYRQASERLPPGAQAAEAAPEPRATPAEPNPAAQASPDPATLAAEPVAAAAPPTVANIQDHVAQAMRKAGRPADEARASGQVTEALWQTRADAFGGAKGTAEEMYSREAPAIRAGRERAVARQPEMAQGAQGKITLATDGRSVITLMKRANASTYLHEVGHDWLERMMMDAGDIAAPDQMRQDAATVRGYLGNDGGDLTTRQHEKFARSFERYFMEGRAPSQALAGVFGQFKAWLIGIYQTVSKLRAPITEDIRDVFDRMLSRDPQHVTVPDEVEPPTPREPAASFAPRAPEALTGDLAALHESDAAETAPEDAVAAADYVHRETAATETQHAPEAVASDDRPTGGNGAGAAESGNPAEHGGSAGGDAGAGGDVSQSGEEPRGRGGAAAEGDRPRGEPGTADPLGRPDDGLIDKAGNIRLDNLATPDDVSQVIRDAAAQNDDFIENRRGVVSDAQVINLADALGMTPGDLAKRKVGEAFNAEQVMAARKLLVQSAINVRDLMAKAAAGSDADVLAYGEARARHLMIQAQVSGITAEAGRALRAFRDLSKEGAGDVQSLNEFLQHATGKTLFQMRREAKAGAMLDTAGQVSKFIGDSAKPTFGDMAMEYWINGLIAGPATHTTYAIGNAMLAIWKAGPETAVASAIGAGRRAMGGGGGVRTGEVGAGLYAIVKGQRDGFRAAYDAARTGLTTQLPGEGASGAAGSMSALPQGAIPGKLGEVIRVPSRGVATIHSYFRSIGYQQGLAQIAYRAAADEGVTGAAFSARLAELTANPSPEMMQAARTEATNQTLMSAGGEFTRKFAELTNTPVFGWRVLKVVDPFVKISSNVLSESLLQRSPLGLLDGDIRANLTGRNGAAARDTQISRILVGSSLMMVAGGLASEGLISGSGPTEPKEAAIWRLAGNQPYSVRIGDTWYGTHRMGPLAMIMGVAADMHDFADVAEGGEMDKMAASLVTSVAKGLLNESFMRGPSDLLKAIDDPKRFGSRYISSLLATLLPFSTAEGQIARATDPYVRSARTMMDVIKSRVPGLSQTLEVKRDIWGQPLERQGDLGADGLTSIAESRVNNDPVNKRLLELKYYPGAPKRDIGGVQLNDQQYDDLSRIGGQMAHQRLTALVNQPGFDTLPAGAQEKAMRGAVEQSHHTAGQMVMMQNPEIITKALAQRRTMVTEGRAAARAAR